MSTEFVVRVPPRVPRSVIDVGLHDLQWNPERPPDRLPLGEWGVHRHRVSTRVTTIRHEAQKLTVTLRSGACLEDCDLALGIVRRAAMAGDGLVDTDDEGQVAIAQIDETFGDTWRRGQLEAAARVAAGVSQQLGAARVFVIPGPTRGVVVGPRVIAELNDGEPSQLADRLVAVMRRVLWPDERYENVSKFQVESPDGASFTVVPLFPERACVLPPARRVALEDADGLFLIPRAVLNELPVRATYLDDGNQLVEAISAEEWSGLCQLARIHEVSA